MSVSDDFERMRLYRNRASEFEWLADNYPTELADREEQSDQARISERLERVRFKRKEATKRTRLSAGSDAPFFVVAAE
jgi:hypothetical protein